MTNCAFEPEPAAELLRALANPLRLTILDALRQGEHSVGEIEARTGIRQPTLSQQLAVLRKASLVATRREAKQIHYRLDETTLAAVGALLDLFILPPMGKPQAGSATPAYPAGAGSMPSSRASGVAVFARITRRG